MSMMRSKIAAGLLFQTRFGGMFPPAEALVPLPESPGAYPVSLEMIGAAGFRGRLFSAWLSFLNPYAVQMEVLYDSLAQ